VLVINEVTAKVRQNHWLSDQEKRKIFGKVVIRTKSDLIPTILYANLLEEEQY